LNDSKTLLDMSSKVLLGIRIGKTPPRTSGVRSEGNVAGSSWRWLTGAALSGRRAALRQRWVGYCAGEERPERAKNDPPGRVGVVLPLLRRLASFRWPFFGFCA